MVHEPAVLLSSPDVFTPAPHSAAAAAVSSATFEVKLRAADRVGSDALCTDTRASDTRSAAVELTAPCTTKSRDTITPEYRSPPRPPLPALRPAPPPPLPAPLPTPPPSPDIYGIGTRLGEGTGKAESATASTSSPRARGASRPTSRRAWSTTHSPCTTTRTTTRSPSANGGTGLRRRRPPSPGTGSLLPEELESSGPAHRDHDEGSPLQPELPRPLGPASHVPECPH